MGRVIVVGSVNMDVVAQTSRLPQPGETLVGSALSTIPGGKGANQAVAAQRAGATATMVGALGTDGFGDTLKEFLQSEGVDIAGVRQVPGSSGTALIIVDDAGENSIVIVPGANDAVTRAAVEALEVGPDDVILLQDEVPEAANEAAIACAGAVGARTVLNLAPYRETSPSLLDQVSYVVVNEIEFALLVGERPETMKATRVAGLLAEAAGPATDIIVTLGSEGLQARVGGSVTRLAGHPVKAVDTTGAGDCFCGAFGAALAQGAAVPAALAFASAAAALSVTVLGAGPSMPHRGEIDAFLTHHDR